MTAPRPSIPWRTIYAVLLAALSVVAGVALLTALRPLLALLVVALFLAVVLSPAVDLARSRLHLPRPVATAVVFLGVLAAVSGMLFMLIRPLAAEVEHFVDDAPRLIEEARAGGGPLGELAQRFELDRRLEENQEGIEAGLQSLGRKSLGILAGIGSAVAGLVTVLFLAFLMLLEGPKLLEGALRPLAPSTGRRVRGVAADAARAVSGYMVGNLIISAIAGAATFAFLAVSGVPYAGALALWVALTDLVPLVGAILGALVVVSVAFLHSVPIGVAAVVFFVFYQQFENHVLQTTVMARTVSISPLVVLVSVLVGIQLAGILGALLAIPVAGIVQVVGRDLYVHRGSGPETAPGVGTGDRALGGGDGTSRVGASDGFGPHRSTDRV